MPRFLLWCGIISFLFSVFQTNESLADEHSVIRGLYWNKTQGPSLSTNKTGESDAIVLVKKLGVSTVHIWLNDNDGPRTCAEKFDYHEQYWSPSTLREFTRLLVKSGRQVVYVVTPKIQTKEFIDSLMETDGPVAIAAEFDSVDIELDMEYNWTEKSRSKLSGCKTIDTKTASSLLVANLKRTSPKSKVIVSTTGNWMDAHKEIIELSDIISPQLYDDRWTSAPPEAKALLRKVLRAYPEKNVIPALSIQCSDADRENTRCSQKNFTDDESLVASLHACDHEKYPSYTIWAANELRPKCIGNGSESVCSYFGEKYLAGSSTILPAAKCDVTLLGRPPANQ